MDLSIDIFKKKVESLAKNRSQEPISHSGKDESAIILGLLFKYARKSVKIYAGNFNGEISNNDFYSNNVKDFLQNGKDLKVVVNDFKSIHSKVFKSISLYSGFQNNVEIVQTETEFYLDGIGPTEGENPVHFAIADNNAFRLEIDTKKYLGVACFNDQEMSKSLSKNFDFLFEKGKHKATN